MPVKTPFRVVHASGQDESYRASELNNHSPLTKGWSSAKYCLYPQDIVIQLDQRTRLRKIQILSHQFLIATKIEFFVGDVPDGIPLSLDNVRYTRLGYVSLSDNDKTGYKARELKSVHVDAVGLFLKLNIHKNHINKFNLYNQVGIVAINVIGDKMHQGSNVTDPDFFVDVTDQRNLDKDPVMDGVLNRPDYISPLDDLAFDMYQDPEIAQIIRKLEKKKQEAVQQEKYDYAKQLKQAISELQKVGEKLGKMEVEKRQAVENEDYDKAKLKKLQMDEYRNQAYRDLRIAELLEASAAREQQALDYGHRQRTPPRMMEVFQTPPQSPPRYDERPLPTARRSSQTGDKTPSPDPDSSQRVPYEERQLPIHKPAVLDELDLEPEPDPETIEEVEPMTEKDLRDASAAIDVFGQQLVSKAYSKTWSYREDSLLAVYKHLDQHPASAGKDDARSMFRAAVFLVKRAIDDKVYAVFKAALQLEKMMLKDFVPRHRLPKQETSYAVEKTMPNLLHKSGDTALRNREDVKNIIFEMAKLPEVKPTNAVLHESVKPIKVSMPPRLAESHCEIVEQLYRDHGLTTNGLTLDNMMTFCVEALNHNAGEVREVSERIIKQLYSDVGAPVKDYLPHDDEKTRKNTLWRQLFEYFDKVDGKPTKDDLQRKKAGQEAKKQAEIEALQKQLQQLKEMQQGKLPVDESLLKKKGPLPKTQKGKVKSKGAAPTVKEDDDVSVTNLDKICIFCGERNNSFNDEGLDLHYWKSCPVLKRCANCKEVVEIASLTDHLLRECESKSNFSKCPRCSEAIIKADFDQHVAEKSCNPAQNSLNHCPLCHENIAMEEDSWKNHLMGMNGCKNNPRRLLALNKPAGKADLKGPAGRGKATTSQQKFGKK